MFGARLWSQRITFSALVGIAALGLIACGGDDDPTGPEDEPDPETGPMTALIDGAAWGANPAGNPTAYLIAPGTYALTGTSTGTAGNEIRSISLNLMNLPGPGAYPLGTGAGVSGGIASYIEPGSGWTTPLSGLAGTLTVTTLTDNRMVGEFAFVANLSTGSGPDTRTISSGAFDVPVVITGTPGEVPDRNRNMISAKFDDEMWVGSTVATTRNPSVMIWSANNTRWSASFSWNGVAAPDTLDLSVENPPISITIGRVDGSATWSLGAGAQGTVAVESVTQSRIAGRFECILPRALGSGDPLIVTDGVFDIGF